MKRIERDRIDMTYVRRSTMISTSGRFNSIPFQHQGNIELINKGTEIVTMSNSSSLINNNYNNNKTANIKLHCNTSTTMRIPKLTAFEKLQHKSSLMKRMIKIKQNLSLNRQNDVSSYQNIQTDSNVYLSHRIPNMKQRIADVKQSGYIKKKIPSVSNMQSFFNNLNLRKRDDHINIRNIAIKNSLEVNNIANPLYKMRRKYVSLDMTSKRVN